MVLGIKQKMYAVMFIGVLILVVSMSLFVRWNFQRGFIHYVNTIEKPMVNQLVQDLQEYYHHAGTWIALQNNTVLWRQMVRQGRQGLDMPPPLPHDIKPMMSGVGRTKRGLALRLKNRLQVLDEKRGYIAGAHHLPTPSLHELVDNQKIVGYLAYAPPKAVSDSHQLSFLAEQKKSLGWIALFTLLAAGFLSLPIAHRLVKRVQVVASGTNKLAAGDYTTRIPVDSEDEMGQLAADFNSLAGTLQKNEQVRRDWIADISHELRTPLTVLRGELEALQDGVREISPRTIDTLHGEVVHLAHLVDDLYELSMSDIGALTYRKVLLSPLPLVKTSVELFAHRFSEKGQSLEIKCSPEADTQISADPERLQQLLNNLLENSLRYTDRGGSVEVALARVDKMVELTVCDSAPSVPDGDLSCLFDRLYRGESSRNRALGGRGLGLSICQNIVEAHGGTINVEPSELGGLCVRVRLPLPLGVT